MEGKKKKKKTERGLTPSSGSRLDVAACAVVAFGVGEHAEVGGVGDGGVGQDGGTGGTAVAAGVHEGEGVTECTGYCVRKQVWA